MTARRERTFTYLVFFQRGGWKYRFTTHFLTPLAARRLRSGLQKHQAEKGVKVRLFREVTRP